MDRKHLRIINSATPSRLESEWSENLDSFSTLSVHTPYSDGGRNISMMLWELFDIPVLLIIIGILSASLSFLAYTILLYGDAFRLSLVNKLGDFSSITVYCIYCTVLTLSATVITQMICPQCVGGGLPEMKTILGGVVKPVLLSKRLIVAKFSGLLLSLLGGLSVGKEGPYVHISAAIADQLMRLPIFQHIRRQDGRRLEIIACACASGVSSSFSAVFGGVLFSIEFTASAYRVKNLPKACLTSMITIVTFFILGGGVQQLPDFDPNNATSSHLNNPTAYELIGFALFGTVCGLLGALLVTLVQAITSLRNHLLNLKLNNKFVVSTRRYVLVGVVTLIVSYFTYVENALAPGDRKQTVIERIIAHPPLHSSTVSLIVYFFYKVLITALSVTLPLPVGLFTPVFLTGGVLGRIIGEILAHFPGLTAYAPWEISLVGAAAFSTGVVRAISTVVIVYEVSGQPHLLVPISVAVLCAYFAGNRLTKNIYEVLMHTSNTPYLKDLPRELYGVPVAQVMVPLDENHVLSLNSTYNDAATLLELLAESTDAYISQATRERNAVAAAIEGEKEEEEEFCIRSDLDLAADEKEGKVHRAPYVYHHIPAVIPVVQSKRSMVIVGAVLRTDLKRTVTTAIAMVTAHKTPPVALGLAQTPSTENMPLVGATAAAPSRNTWDIRTPIDISRRPQSQSYSALDTVSSTNSLVSESGQLMDEILQYVIVTDSGRVMKPIRNAALQSESRRPRRRWTALSLAIVLDTSPYQVVDSMHLSKVDMLFRMLSLNQAYVTNSGRLVGLVTRASLREFIGSRSKQPFDRCRRLWSALIAGGAESSRTSRTRDDAGGYVSDEGLLLRSGTTTTEGGGSLGGVYQI